MSTLIGLAVVAITAFQLLLLIRVVSSWVLVFAGHGAQRPGLHRVDEALARITDPVLAPIRRFLPPLRLGGLTLDLAIPIVLIALSVLGAVLSGL